MVVMVIVDVIGVAVIIVISKGRSNDTATQSVVILRGFQWVHLSIDHMQQNVGEAETGQNQNGDLSDAPS